MFLFLLPLQHGAWAHHTNELASEIKISTASSPQHGMQGRVARLLYEVPDILLVTVQITRLQAQVCLQDIAAFFEGHGPVAAGQSVICQKKLSRPTYFR